MNIFCFCGNLQLLNKRKTIYLENNYEQIKAQIVLEYIRLFIISVVIHFYLYEKFDKFIWHCLKYLIFTKCHTLDICNQNKHKGFVLKEITYIFKDIEIENRELFTLKKWLTAGTRT